MQTVRRHCKKRCHINFDGTKNNSYNKYNYAWKHHFCVSYSMDFQHVVCAYDC